MAFVKLKQIHVEMVAHAFQIIPPYPITIVTVRMAIMEQLATVSIYPINHYSGIVKLLYLHQQCQATTGRVSHGHSSYDLNFKSDQWRRGLTKIQQTS